MRLSDTLIVAIALIVTFCCSSHAETATSNESANFKLTRNSALQIAEKVDERVRKIFYSANLVDTVWRPAFLAEKNSLASSANVFEFSSRINPVLSKLKSSHTQFMTANDESFFFMKSLFGEARMNGKEVKFPVDYTGLGIGGAHALTNQVRYILEGSPAEAAGFRRGDKIISVCNRPYSGFDVWYKTAGKALPVVVQRADQKLTLTLHPIKKDVLEGYKEASEKSARVIHHANKNIGYYHFWSGGEDTHDMLGEALSRKLLETDALILDLRDGYGGASFEDIDFFLRPKAAYPDMKSVSRRGTRVERLYYEKPVAVLINKGTRSGKELMAFGLKRAKRASLFGDTTAGYVLGGMFKVIDDHCALYVAGVDISLDGERLEGKGVSPDYPISDILAEKDVVMEAALDYMANASSNVSNLNLVPSPAPSSGPGKGESTGAGASTSTYPSPNANPSRSSRSSAD